MSARGSCAATLTTSRTSATSPAWRSMSLPNRVAPTMPNVSSLMSRSSHTTSSPARASHRRINDDVSALIVSSNPLTFRWLNRGCISARCFTQCGPSFDIRPLPITTASTR